MDTKICTKCGGTFPATTEYFFVDTRGSYGLRAACKRCRAGALRKYRAQNPGTASAGRRAWRERNKAKLAEQNAKWAHSNQESKRASSRRWGLKNKARRHAYYLKNKARHQEYGARWRAKNSETARRCCREWAARNKASINARYAKRQAADPAFRIFRAVRIRLSQRLNAYKNPDRRSSTQQLGCSADELRSYFESKFLAGMSWDNYGRYTTARRTWTADHYIPLRGRVCGDPVFNPFDQDEVAVAASKFNLFPLWGLDNIRKSNRVPHWDDIPPELQAICTPRIRALLQKVKKTA